MRSGFAAFPLSPAVQSLLLQQGFQQPTPVQEATIPLFCGNTDVCVDACTGSGKTLAFVLPVVERLRRLEAPLRNNQVGAVIVSPTRELARQIFDVAKPFVATVAWLQAALLVGGTDAAADVDAFKRFGGHVLVGTPGRLDDIMQRCTSMDLRTVEVLVLDEADRLLDMGFRAQLDAIMRRLPRQRRTGLFSATQTDAVEALARAGLRNPGLLVTAVSPMFLQHSAVRVNVAVTAALSGRIRGHDDWVSSHAPTDMVQRTPNTLRIQEHVNQKVIVYFLTCACVDFASVVLPRLPQCTSMRIWALHGRMKQTVRGATLAAFAGAPAGILLCTDVAARGLDIPDVHWIVQYDPPQDPSAFVHRVGRTARMGRSGDAVVYLLPHEITYVEFLKVRKIPLQQTALAGELPQVQAELQRHAETDRLVMEAGMKAFLSYVRAYKEHHCKFIFRLQDLSLGQLATSFALLRLPRMPEIKGYRSFDFVPSVVDPESVRFKDKAREKQRQAALRQRRLQGQAGVAQPDRRRQQATLVPEVHLPAAKRRKMQEKNDLDELQRDYSLLRKFNKGKLSAAEFEAATLEGEVQ
ncbi:DEAD-box ATP-dependent RNA helicase 18 [Chlorella vulgaris]